ncbi:MAG: integral membrane protein [Candidatus Scalindua rubra]|uniref:Integral membrane protein n=1 Tax=Candidatus Scalindua rubra TaxID=1872076 RepID=A0A1E3XF12_9BACT|nr:MAG: integral membrane protein [Candidatus Scalindua rubra]
MVFIEYIGINEGSVNNLSANVEIKGMIMFDKTMNIDGKFEGELISNDGDLNVGKTGKLKANIRVKNAIISGQVDGNITTSEKVELKKDARVIGDLNARTLAIEEGVVFVGKCNVIPADLKIEKQDIKEEIVEERKDKYLETITTVPFPIWISRKK